VSPLNVPGQLHGLESWRCPAASVARVPPAGHGRGAPRTRRWTPRTPSDCRTSSRRGVYAAYRTFSGTIGVPVGRPRCSPPMQEETLTAHLRRPDASAGRGL